MAISKKTTNLLNERIFTLILFTIMVTFLSVLTTMVIIKAEDDARLPNLVLTYGNKNKTITKDEEILHHYFNDEDLMYILEVTNDTGLEVLVTSDDTVISAAGNKYIISFIKKTTVINIQIDEEGKNTKSINITIKVDVPFPFGLINEENKEEITVTNDKKYPWVFDPLETSRIAYKSTNHVIDYDHYEFLEFIINGPGILYFDYKTSLSLGENFLAIYVNGDLVNETDTDRFSGNKDWQTTYLLLNEGENIINIAYNKAVVDGNNDTVWIANFGFTAGSTSDQLTIGFSIDGSEYGTVSGLELGTNNLDLLTSVNLVATPNSDALFIGWRNDETNEFISYQRSFDFVAYKNLSIEAVFISKNHVARIGTTTYDSLEGALDEATFGDIVVLMQSVTLTNNITVPKGVTLLIPYSENDYFGYVEVDYLNEIIKVNPNGTIDGRAELFRTLSVPSNVTLTVEGTLLVNALTGRPAAGSYNQDNAGGYAQINLEGLIEVEDGGLLDVLGFVKGSGRVIAKDGAEVGDLFVVKNWRGGSVALEVFSAGVFPFNQYDCHNIEATLEIRKGASYYGNVKMFALGQFFYTKFYQISSHTEQGKSGLIRLDGDESFVLKEYDVLTKRTTLTISGDATEIGGTLELSGMEQSTNDFLYPIDGHITFVLTNGNFTILNKLKFLPGSKLIVEETATLVIGSPYLFINAEVIFYENFNDAFIGPTQYPSDLEPASFELYGQLEIYGAFATKFEQIGINATIYLSESAVLKVLSKESGPNFAIAQVIEYEAHLILPSIPSPKGLYNMWAFMDDDFENALDDEWFDLGIPSNGELVLGHLLYIKAYPDEPEVEIFITKIDNKRVVKIDINNMNEEFLTYSYTWYQDGVKIPNENLAYIDISSFGYGTYYCEVTAEFDGMGTFVYSDEISVFTKDISAIEVEVLPIGNVTYNGYFIEPKVTVNDGDTLLIEGTDYELTYLNNKNAGVATILINGIGQYDGTKTINFVIEKLVVTTNWSNQESFVYNGLNQIENVKATIQGVGSDNTIILNLSENDFKNVGTYDFVAFIDNDNYTLTNTSKTYTIAPLVISVNWSVEDNFVYNGLDQSNSVMASIQGVGNDNMIMLNLSVVTFINAGSYDFVANLDNDNYTLTNTSKSYTIVPLSVEVIWSELNNFYYNGFDQSDSVMASIQGVGSDNMIMLNLSEVTFKNVGSYDFVASLDNDNYTLTNTSKSYTIVPLEVEVIWSIEDNFVYNGLDQSGKVSAYLFGVGNDGIIDVTLTKPDFKNVGAYEIGANLDNTNYTLTNNFKSYTIVPFELEVNWSVEDNFVYNGFDQKSNVTAYINGVGNDDIINVTLTTPDFKNVGKFEFNASLDNANYTLTNNSKTYTIVPFELDVNWSADDNFVYNGFDQKSNVTAYIEGVGNDGIIDVTLTTPDFKNAGTFAFVASLENANYTLTNTAKPYTIVPLELAVNWSVEDTFVYNGLDQSENITAYIIGVGNDDVKIYVTLTAPEFKNVGTFAFVASLDNTNYTLTNTVKSYTIVPLVVEVNWSVENNFVYNGLDQKNRITAYIEGVGNDDIINVTLTAPEFKNVGEYEFVASLDNANYMLTNTSKSYTIIPLVVEVIWSVEDNFTYNGLDQKSNIIANINGVGNDDIINVTLTAPEFKNVGTFKFIASLDNANYTLTNTSKSYIIVPLVVEVIWSEEAIFEFSGLNQSDKVSAYINGVSGKVDVILTAPEFKNVGEYEFVGSLDNANYTFINTSKIYTIVPFEVEVIWSVEDNFEYSGLDIKSNITAYINGVGNDGIIDVTLTTPEFKNVGTFAFVASLDNANYTLTNTSKSYTIVPLVVEVNWSLEDEFVYNGLDQSGKVSAYINGVGNDNIIDVTLTAPDFKNVGTFEFVANLDNANYTLTNTAKSYTIVPFGVEVIWSLEDDFEYSGLDQSGKVLAYINGVGNDDIIDIALTVDAFTNVGTFEFNASLDNANYTLINISKSYTIVPFGVEVIWSVEDNFGYNGFDQSGKVSAYINGVGSDDIINVTLTAPEFKNAGKFAFIASLDNGNYTLTNTSKTYTIVPLVVEVNWSVEDGFEYSGLDQSGKVSAYINGVGNDGKIDVTLTTVEFINVGEYVFIASLNNDNYSLINTVKTYFITPLTVEVSWLDKTSFIYNGFDQSENIYVLTDYELEFIITFNKIFKDVGQYQATVTFTNNNYKPSIPNKIYEIIPKLVNVNWASFESLTYNGFDQSAMVTAFVDGVGNDGKIDLVVSFANEFKNVGNYPVYASLNNQNYQLESATKQYVINPANVKILIDNKESTYKEPIVNLTYQLEGYLFGNDNLNVSLFTDATANSNVGNYFINGSASNSNYIIEIITATYKIIKANQHLNPLSLNTFIITYNAVTVIPIDGAVYSIDGEHYDLNNVFNQLLPLTEYHIFVKLFENDNYRESNIVSIIVMTKADTSEFDTLVNRMIIEDAKDLFNDIKEALSILNQIGREHFDPIMVQKLDEIIEGYNDYLTSIHQEFETALYIGNLVTSHVDIVNIIYQITTVINLMAITLGVLMLRKFKRE